MSKPLYNLKKRKNHVNNKVLGEDETTFCILIFKPFDLIQVKYIILQV